MVKPMIAVLLLGAAASGWKQDVRSVVPLEGGKIVLERGPGAGAVVRISAESETVLECVRILRPDGRKLVELDARDSVPNGLASLEIELREPDLARLLAKYPAGTYRIVAETAEGRRALGEARLSLDFPPRPRILLPRPSGLVPASDLRIAWMPVHDVAAYEVEVEQEDDDGGLRVRLPPEQSTFHVPPGVLAPGKETAVEVVAIGANGNRTAVEVSFVTAP